MTVGLGEELHSFREDLLQLVARLDTIIDGHYRVPCADGHDHCTDCQSVRLSRREKQILHLITQGLSVREIADQLVIGVKTVGTHRVNLYRKLGVHSATQLMVAAMKHDLIEGGR